MSYVLKLQSIGEILSFAVEKRFFNHIIVFFHLQWQNFFHNKMAKILLVTNMKKSFSAIWPKNHYKAIQQQRVSSFEMNDFLHDRQTVLSIK